ncbi:hypothetical protein HAALTHF_40640n [Vreelandella aquamarina]|nr:hypothetical protein HAALTHF_40640n [Halomonas axialensis]
MSLSTPWRRLSPRYVKWVLMGSLMVAAYPAPSVAEPALHPTLEAADPQTPYAQWRLQQWRSRMDAPLSAFSPRLNNATPYSLDSTKRPGWPGYRLSWCWR